jgi:hypothetical protein
MREAAAVLCFFLAFALLHGSSANRMSRWRARRSGRLPGLLRAGALAAIAVGVTSWTRAENVTAALLVALAAVSVAATAVILLMPLFPRTLWVLALACPVLIVVLLAVGGRHG